MWGLQFKLIWKYWKNVLEVYNIYQWMTENKLVFPTRNLNNKIPGGAYVTGNVPPPEIEKISFCRIMGLFQNAQF